jgi:hypothetical protein
MSGRYEKENRIVARFFDDVKKLNAMNIGIHIKAIKLHGGIFTSGEPDVVGSIVAFKMDDETLDPEQVQAVNRAFAIEFKSPSAAGKKGDATQRQKSSLSQWSLAGALTGVAKSVEEAMTVIGIGVLWNRAIGSKKRKKAEEGEIGVGESFD